jgi:tetratricopeptide (TPR) repeat protein
VGWFWFLGTLVPVIGLVQVGHQALADRYTYVPHIGLFVAVVWGAWRAAARCRSGPLLFAIGTAGLLLACTVLTWRQVRYWHDSETLWWRALQVTRHNHIAHYNYGVALASRGEVAQALPYFEQAVQLKPRYLDARNDLGVAYLVMGRNEEALRQFEAILDINPHHARALDNLGRIRARAHHDRGVALGRRQPALLQEAHEAHRQAVELQPREAYYRGYLAWTLHRLGETASADTEYRQVLQIDPDWAEKTRRQAWQLATDPHEPLRDGATALELAEQACQASPYARVESLDTLAAALAENRRYLEAAKIAQEAHDLAVRQGQKDLAAEIRARLQLYQEERPYRSP